MGTILGKLEIENDGDTVIEGKLNLKWSAADYKSDDNAKFRGHLKLGKGYDGAEIMKLKLSRSKVYLEGQVSDDGRILSMNVGIGKPGQQPDALMLCDLKKSK